MPDLPDLAPVRAVRAVRAVPRSRGPLLAALALTLVAGVATTRLPASAGPLGDAAGDGLYAVAVWLVLALLAPRTRTLVLTSTTFGLCALVELAQLTGGPAAVVDAFPPARYLLGTTFVATDLLAYAVGSLAATALDLRLPRRAPVSAPG